MTRSYHLKFAPSREDRGCFRLILSSRCHEAYPNQQVFQRHDRNREVSRTASEERLEKIWLWMSIEERHLLRL